MLRTTLASSRVLRVCVLGLVTVTTAVIFTSDSADARRYRHRHHARHHHEARAELQPAILLDHRRRQFRRDAVRQQPRRQPPSRLADQDHDALSAVRAARGRQDEARYRNGRVRARLRTGADQARPAPRPDHQGRRRHQGTGDALGQRRRRRDRRSHRRRRRRFRQADDAQGARARHDARRSIATPPACPTTNRSPPRATSPRSAAPSRIASRATTAISRPPRSTIAASRSATTTACSATSKASTASRPATPAPPASIS